jgi:hypothetical protein
MFAKLDVKLKKDKILSQDFRGKHISTYGYISYYQLNKSYMLLPLNLFRLNPDVITWTEVDPSANLPHKDFKVMTNLNIYIEPCAAVTRFSKPKVGVEPYTTDPGNFYPNLYRLEDLEYAGEFTAMPYEAYLLDVTQVHQVAGLEAGTRSMIQLSWSRTPYQEVLNKVSLL